ncbi:MAG: redoxin domain-containing protein [Polyangiales bacterium]|jgi:peroxiredoxin
MSITPGTPAPAFELVDQARQPVSLDSLRGKKTLVVFIPFPFTGICEGELCLIRDSHAQLNGYDANVVVITCDTPPANKKWSDDNGFEFPVLSDFWPHGATAQAYGAFNDTMGVANRYTFVLDADGIVRDVINTDSLGEAREFEAYTAALQAIS